LNTFKCEMEYKMKKRIIIKITIFMVITFVFSIILALLQESLRIDYQYLTLPQWAPGIAALILGFTVYKNIPDKDVTIEKHALVRLFLLLIVPFVLIGFSYILSSTMNLITENKIQLDFKLLYIVIPGSLFGALGEALGWRKFLQLYVDKHFHYYKSAVIVGLLWGLWHVGNYSNGLIYMALFLIFTICASLMLSIFIRKYNYNLFLAALFHLSINLGFYIFFRAYLENVNMMLINALVWVAATVTILYVFKIKTNKKEMKES